ncbi:MAG: hypothetical protein AAF585_10195 [Verrucomicrobiota bacterium]
MSRERAINWLKQQGFDAFERTWWYGETIAISASSDSAADGEPDYIYVFPTKTGWGLLAPSILSAADYSQSMKLEDACELALKFLNCPDLPIQPEDVTITTGRAIHGDFSHISHNRTGIIKELFRTTGNGREVLRERTQALDELAFDLALQPHEQNEQAHPAANPGRLKS